MILGQEQNRVPPSKYFHCARRKNMPYFIARRSAHCFFSLCQSFWTPHEIGVSDASELVAKQSASAVSVLPRARCSARFLAKIEIYTATGAIGRPHAAGGWCVGLSFWSGGSGNHEFELYQQQFRVPGHDLWF